MSTLSRLDRAEKVIMIDEGNKIYLSLPPEDNEYEVREITNGNVREMFFTEEEFNEFRKNSEHQIIEVRWTP